MVINRPRSFYVFTQVRLYPAQHLCHLFCYTQIHIPTHVCLYVGKQGLDRTHLLGYSRTHTHIYIHIHTHACIHTIIRIWHSWEIPIIHALSRFSSPLALSVSLLQSPYLFIYIALADIDHICLTLSARPDFPLKLLPVGLSLITFWRTCSIPIGFVPYID